jgi:hypothetical protein
MASTFLTLVLLAITIVVICLYLSDQSKLKSPTSSSNNLGTLVAGSNPLTLAAQRIYNKGAFTNLTNWPILYNYSQCTLDPVIYNCLASYYKLTNDDADINQTRILLCSPFYTSLGYYASACTQNVDQRLPASNFTTALTKPMTPCSTCDPSVPNCATVMGPVIC